MTEFVGAQLIPLVNQLHDVFSNIGGERNEHRVAEGLDMPQIVVVGSQSSGKSSVLESVVGRDFLPRGSGIVTRRPLVLQLVRSRDPSEPDWAEFLHKPNVRFTDFNAVRDEIAAETERLTGANKGVSRQPISLRIHSPRVVDLTLVDLPGITRVPVGDQPKTIEQDIRSMVNEYIANPGSIILAVTAANTDLSTSDALQVAREVDPAGQRTLGVLTKLDILDRGTDASEFLGPGGMGKNGSLALKLGYVGVVCRGQADIANNKSLLNQLADERRFFATHPKYQQHAQYCGCTYLAKRLSQLLACHIKERLPSLRQQVFQLLAASKGEADSLLCGEEGAATADAIAQGSGRLIVLHSMNNFAAQLREAVDGRLSTAGCQKEPLDGGSSIANTFDQSFSRNLEEKEAVAAKDLMQPDEIQRVISSAAGPRASLFVPEAAFDQLVRRRIEPLEQLGMACADQVHEQVRKLVEQLGTGIGGELLRYPSLRELVIQEAQRLVSEHLAATKEMIHNLVRIELCHINTSHPDFLGGERAVGIVNERMAREGALALSGGSRSSSVASSHNDGVPLQRRCPMCDELVVCHTEQEFDEHLARCLGRLEREETSGRGAAAAAGPGQGISSAVATLKQAGSGCGPSMSFAGNWFKGGVVVSAALPTNSAAGALSKAVSPAVGTGTEKALVVASPHQYGAQHAVAAGTAGDKAVSQFTDKQLFQVELVRTLVESYMQVVKKNLKDSIPKSVMCFLVRDTLDALQKRLVQVLYKMDDKSVAQLVQEDSEVASKREECTRKRQALQRAADVLSSIKIEPV